MEPGPVGITNALVPSKGRLHGKFAMPRGITTMAGGSTPWKQGGAAVPARYLARCRPTSNQLYPPTDRRLRGNFIVPF